jgi:ADP-heptose:LPS heptosyltransferase
MKRLLVIRFSALGDVALLVPVVRALAEQYPETEITVLSHRRMQDLFGDLPKNVLFHGIDTHADSLRAVANSLGRFDVVADMHDVWRSRYVRMRMRLRGARVARIHKGRLAKWCRTHGWSHQALQPTVERYADVLRRVGLPITLPLPAPHTSGTGVGIAPFAAHNGKVYPLEQMEQVVRMLSEKGESVVLFGSKEEANILDEWAKKFQGVTSVAGRYTLREELDVIRGLRVMVSMDSANMHLASLVGTRVVSIWGATHPHLGFLGFGQKEEDCVQRDLPCRPCSVYGKKACRYGDYRCLAIPPQTIVEKLL